ncbi:MAG: Mpo1-like protein [Lysobacteraceae bacterium]
MNGDSHYYSGGVLAWQWRYYASWHQDRLNLLLHMATVPLFIAGLLAAGRQAFFGEWFGAAIAALLALFAVGIQWLGHLREPARAPSAGNLYDTVRRVLAEQFITFPRFVLSGGWLHQMVSQPRIDSR